MRAPLFAPILRGLMACRNLARPSGKKSNPPSASPTPAAMPQHSSCLSIRCFRPASSPLQLPSSCISIATGYSGGGKKMIAAYEDPAADPGSCEPRVLIRWRFITSICPKCSTSPALLRPPEFLRPIVCGQYSQRPCRRKCISAGTNSGQTCIAGKNLPYPRRPLRPRKIHPRPPLRLPG